MNIKKVFIIIFVFLIVLPTITIIYIILNNYYSNIMQGVLTEKQALLTQMNRNISFRLKAYEKVSSMIYFNNEILDYINKEDFSEPSSELYSTLTGIINNDTFMVSAIALFDDLEISTGKALTERNTNFFESNFRSVNQEKGRPVWLETSYINTGYKAESPMFALSRAINSKQHVIGSLWFFISADFFNENLQSSSKDTTTYILSGNKILASSDYKLAGTMLDEEYINEALNKKGVIYSKIYSTKYVIVYNTISDTDWKIVMITPEHEIVKEAGGMFSMTLVVFIFYLFFLLTTFFMLSRIVFNPLIKLNEGMEKISKGNFSYRLQERGKNEISRIARGYNKMADQIIVLMQNIKKREKEKNAETIKVLSMQIGSHFLYNTLNTIKWMAVVNNQSQIKDVVQSLIKLLMSFTNHFDEHIPLKDEIELIQHYTVIQKARYANFKIEYDVSDELSEYMIDKMLLQPVVENCIVHGFAGTNTIGIIRITARLKKDTLVISIKDNGRGFDIGTAVKKKKESIGLDNVLQRLRLNYEEKGTLKISSVIGGGTEVTLCIPAEKHLG